MTFAAIEDRLAAADSIDELDRLGRSLSQQLAHDSMSLFRLALSLDERRDVLRKLVKPSSV